MMRMSPTTTSAHLRGFLCVVGWCDVSNPDQSLQPQETKTCDRSEDPLFGRQTLHQPDLKNLPKTRSSDPSCSLSADAGFLPSRILIKVKLPIMPWTDFCGSRDWPPTHAVCSSPSARYPQMHPSLTSSELHLPSPSPVTRCAICPLVFTSASCRRRSSRAAITAEAVIMMRSARKVE